MKKRISIWSAIGLALVLLIASCNPTPVQETVEVTRVVEKVVTATPEPATITGDIRVGSWDSGDALEPFNNAIESFEQAYPEAEVQLEAVPQEYGTKLLAQLAAGTAPDVFQVGDGDVAKFVAQDVVQPLEPYISGDNPLDMDVLYPAIADFGEVGGTTYFMTKDYSPLVLYYNKDMFKEADLEFPSSDWTWDDLLDAARTLTVDADGNSAASADFDPENVERWGIQLPDTWGDPLWLRGILPFIYQNGGSVINGDGTQVTGHLNGPETVEALEWYVDLFQTHYVAPDREDVQALSGVDLFQSELTAMVWTGRWPLKDYLANPDLNFGTMGLPAGPTGTKANTLCWAGFGIYAESDNKETAWAFLKHIGAGEGAEEFAKYAFTAVEPIAELQGLDSDPYNAPIVEDLENVVQLPDFTTPKFGECVESNFREELEKVFLQDKAVQAAMDDVAALADSCLAEGD